jgi:hypothetical protein
VIGPTEPPRDENLAQVPTIRQPHPRNRAAVSVGPAVSRARDPALKVEAALQA